MIYVPADFLNFINTIKLEKGVDKTNQAFGEIKNFALVGREVERIVYFGKVPKKKNGFGGFI